MSQQPPVRLPPAERADWLDLPDALEAWRRIRKAARELAPTGSIAALLSAASDLADAVFKPQPKGTVPYEKFAELLRQEHALSDAYVRLREIIGAMDPPTVSDSAQLWAYVESVARDKVAAAQAPAPAPEALTDEEVGALTYEGNTVSYIKQRAKVYGDEIMACWQALREAGFVSLDGRLSHAIRTALATQAPAVTHPAWQPIKTAPKDGTHILVWTDASDTAYVVCWADAAKGIRKYLTAESGAERGWHLAWDGELFDREHEPTHWMPLPDAPGFDVPVQPLGGA